MKGLRVTVGETGHGDAILRRWLAGPVFERLEDQFTFGASLLRENDYLAERSRHSLYKHAKSLASRVNLSHRMNRK
jgi:hypothetical protein